MTDRVYTSADYDEFAASVLLGRDPVGDEAADMILAALRIASRVQAEGVIEGVTRKVLDPFYEGDCAAAIRAALTKDKADG
jgi:hypothetical protein